jgi:hypothetical protein
MRYTAALLLGASLFFVACKREDPVVIAGKGGNATLRITPQHGGGAEEIEDAMLYIKYNTKDKPADDRYDDSVACNIVDGKPMGAFTGLKKGDYYLYGTGWNPDHGDIVKGGLPYTIDDENKVYNIVLNLGH